jgi:nicotinate-nucleotide adenylyltransferase
MRDNTIAILGGAFNPIHFGHLAIAEAANKKIGYDTVLFVPSSIPAHKEADPDTADKHRIAMMELAVSGIGYIRTDLCEIERGGVSYTIETVEYIESSYIFEGKLGLIIGDDLLTGFHKWKRLDELIERVDLIVAARFPDADRAFDYVHMRLDNPLVDVASREIRNKVRSRENIDTYVPKEVIRYIDEHRLYQD